MRNKIRFLHGGLMTSIQDRGRSGYMQYGVAPAGAMDLFSMSIANLLVGNNKEEAVLETTYLGPTIEFLCDETISITGAKTLVTLNDLPVPLWQSLEVKAGDILKMNHTVSGIYNYIAFSRGQIGRAHV